MATKRSEVVTFEGLSASLDKAFAVAGKRHGAEFEAGTLANTVISSMKLKGVQPAVIGFDKWILVGFWDPRIRDIEGIRTGPQR